MVVGELSAGAISFAPHLPESLRRAFPPTHAYRAISTANKAPKLEYAALELGQTGDINFQRKNNTVHGSEVDRASRKRESQIHNSYSACYLVVRSIFPRARVGSVPFRQYKFRCKFLPLYAARLFMICTDTSNYWRKSD